VPLNEPIRAVESEHRLKRLFQGVECTVSIDGNETSQFEELRSSRRPPTLTTEVIPCRLLRRSIVSSYQL
jgi:hypothetical protein